MNSLKVIPLGGLGEIGMNCMVFESEKDLFIVDCGLLFSDLDHFGVEFIIPDFNYIVERKDKIRAIVITHGHEDHIGALPFLLKLGIEAPVFASPFSSLLIREKFKDYGLGTVPDLRTFKMGDELSFGEFKIETVSVNHSIVDAAALIIKTPLGQIIHTGDFKIDPTPFFGEGMDLDRFSAAGEKGVRLLLSDSTNVERHEHSMSESVIYQRFEQLFAAAQGLTIVSMFASNVGRVGQVVDLAKKMNKKILISGRGMDQNVRLAEEAQYLEGLESLLIGPDDLDSYPRNQVIVISTGSQAEYRSSLIRISRGEHPFIKLREGDTVLMSSKFIPGNERAIGRMINQLFKQGAEVLYEAVHDIHVSGHATRPELKEMIQRVKPQYFVPIHGEYRHLVHHAKLAVETGVPAENVLKITNGDVIELTKDNCQVVDRIEETRVLVEGRDGADVSKLVLKERRQLGGTGVVFTLIVRNEESGQIISGPEIISKGLAAEEREVELLEKSKKLVRRIVADYEKALRTQRGPEQDLQETIRIQLRRFYFQQLGKKPTVLPIILDL